MKKKTHFSPLALASIFLWIILTASFCSAQPGTQKKVVIVPFDTNAKNNISYIKEGVSSMLRSRLTWDSNVTVLARSKTLKALSGLNAPTGYDALVTLGTRTDADYVITGVITQFSGALSIDTKVYDLKDRSYLTFFGQADSIDQLIPQVDIVAAKINKKIFERTTVSYEKFEKKRIITEEELRRMNPERMMPVPGTLSEEDKPWWKIW